MVKSSLGRIALVAAVAAAFTATSAEAQDGVVPGYMDIGPAIGIGGIGDASLAFGGRFERAIKTLPSMGDGVLGIQASVDYYSWDADVFDASFSYIPIGVTANYHFKMTDKKFDPFVGLGLGFSIVSCDWPGIGFDPCEDSELYFIAKAGARYFLSPRMALYGDIGAGAATLNVGLMFKLK